MSGAWMYAWEGGVYGMKGGGSEVNLIIQEHNLTFRNTEQGTNYLYALCYLSVRQFAKLNKMPV